MLEQPCPICGHTLEINEAVCPRCGVPRRRRRRPSGTPSLLAYLLAACLGGALGSVIGVATSLAAQNADSGTSLGLGTIGALSGVCVAWVRGRQQRG